jgi:uncharacterized membrane protein
MSTTRLEAFSDGVLAIIITIMVLEMKVPHGTDLDTLRPLAPVFAAYAMSFVYVGIYWNNHHHMLHLTEHIDGPVLWANLHLLFWLSLIPFVTGWMSENEFAALPTALYGCVLLLAAAAWLILQTAILRNAGANSRLRTAVGRDLKGKLSSILYAVAIAAAFWHPWIAISLYVLVAGIWLIPDRRFESRIQDRAE